uniref:J domain-containing protein n=1 Tax=Trieres chinensis TaxID=1514140 RepID=A0A7S1ZB06_TRICV|mmetsp:Transcript_21632/g.43723  ORF Transcript_21632/g.43723 Transcript_21632/m.43723 type:complete len:279 (+) Transcript_21632:80-916(+)|eukprot:CAMPEP_0183312314 /NCGR_PEP_ID=MMETSP0160_2-20130417/41219_1 /TAXON_ID=2839 ORGANISM="Odontella Sinensis, Strain Grunow 1884" /NCGR_SAMPLE_ID=MMETSP0160_2 /ASSEMBLY_ACC=CAM_ASM_000250 /LENGTH=278 /DNA_ID=CAMNT_0025477147 /DNA_START=52 /DNA_END=888 /DNA_ORIENTATION=+
MASSAGGKFGGASRDFYRVLNVDRRATRKEIKEAYRKLALMLHPDTNEGCNIKADEFKNLNEAFETLSDDDKRTEYDVLSGKLGGMDVNGAGMDGRYNRNRRKPPPRDYRKVYSARPPPGFKIFDHEKHYSMHYGDGQMKEEIARAREKYKQASKAFGTDGVYEYKSPLGKGFTFDGWKKGTDARSQGNPYSKKPQGPEANGVGQQKEYLDVEYEEAHFYNFGEGGNNFKSGKSKLVNRKETVRDRMHERRKNRIRNRGDPPAYSAQGKEEAAACVVM